MIYASQFLASNFPIGATMTGYRFPTDKWLIADGRALLRSSYPLLSAMLPIGTVTSSNPTLATAPNQPMIASANTLFIAAGATTANAIQVNNTGGTGTWSSIATSGLTLSGLTAIYNSGTSQYFVHACNSAAAQPYVGILNSSGALVSWTVSTGGPTTVAAGTSMSRMFSATVGGVKYAMCLPSASGNLLYYSVMGTTSYSSFAVGETSVKQAGCWSGQKFLILKAGSANMLTLTPNGSPSPITGAIPATVVLPEPIASGQGNIDSDQNGTVVITGVASGILVSFDHGQTFVRRQVRGVTPSDTWRVQYSNGYWLIPTTQGMLVSPDAKRWQLLPILAQHMAVAVGAAKNGQNLVQVIAASTSAFRLVESTTEMQLPNLRRYGWNPAVGIVPMEPTYIKVK